MTDSIHFELNCDIHIQQNLRKVLEPLLAKESDAQYLAKKSFDGDAATWIVIATLAAQALPHILKFLSDWRKEGSVTRIKIGDIEIENPSEKDLQILRQKLSRNIDN